MMPEYDSLSPEFCFNFFILVLIKKNKKLHQLGSNLTQDNVKKDYTTTPFYNIYYVIRQTFL